MDSPEFWNTFYYAQWQWPWALLVVPFAYLMFRAATLSPRGGAAPEHARSLAGYLTLFAILTMVDPIATGPLAKALDDETASTVLGLFFVLLGDFRVYLLVFYGVAPAEGVRAAVLRAAGMTAVVPIFAYVVNTALASALGDVPSQVLWLSHELAFVAVALWLARSWVPGRLGVDGPRSEFLRAVLGFVVAYYSLWAAADVLILFGWDEGWAVRLVPNQLYYALFIPFVHLRFFGVR